MRSVDQILVFLDLQYLWNKWAFEFHFLSNVDSHLFNKQMVLVWGRLASSMLAAKQI